MQGLWWVGLEFGLAETNWVCQCALETGLMEKMRWNLLTEDWEARGVNDNDIRISSEFSWL